ncbi:unnamed protein product [Adineta ricciae]|uniref:Uncharacterized protein n=1 Tax=Adineta ricciae TaxID=249248 RepID=A0A815W7T0_ADIRI|nr:unnamed protein product [Adineta ricciae]
MISLTQLIALTQTLPINDDSEAVYKSSNSVVQNDAQFVNKTISIDSNVRPGNIVIIWLGEQVSSLRTTLEDHLTAEDVILLSYSMPDQLWHWLKMNPSITLASLIIEVKTDLQEVVKHSHSHRNVRSIVVRCTNNELLRTQRSVRSYAKIDGVFADDTRLLIKVSIDLALFSEELGDQKREDENNELEAQRHYARAFRFCAFAREL